MKKLMLFLALFIFLGINAMAQTVTLQMCERYGQYGPEGVGNTFTPGYLTVVAYSTSAMYYTNIFIQFDKLKNGQYKYYKKFPFTFPNGYSTVYFSRGKTNDMSFDSPGYYNVWLLDSNGYVIASTTVTIVSK